MDRYEKSEISAKKRKSQQDSQNQYQNHLNDSEINHKSAQNLKSRQITNHSKIKCKGLNDGRIEIVKVIFL